MSSDASRLDHACYLLPYLLVSPLQFCVVSVAVGSILGAAAAAGAAFVVAFIGLLVIFFGRTVYAFSDSSNNVAQNEGIRLLHLLQTRILPKKNYAMSTTFGDFKLCLADF